MTLLNVTAPSGDCYGWPYNVIKWLIITVFALNIQTGKTFVVLYFLQYFKHRLIGIGFIALVYKRFDSPSYVNACLSSTKFDMFLPRNWTCFELTLSICFYYPWYGRYFLREKGNLCLHFLKDNKPRKLDWTADTIRNP